MKINDNNLFIIPYAEKDKEKIRLQNFDKLFETF